MKFLQVNNFEPINMDLVLEFGKNHRTGGRGEVWTIWFQPAISTKESITEWQFSDMQLRDIVYRRIIALLESMDSIKTMNIEVG